jgi:peptidoglycan/xylan/chitin deacetylase (PgdA/CDA1 family)
MTYEPAAYRLYRHVFKALDATRLNRWPWLLRRTQGRGIIFTLHHVTPQALPPDPNVFAPNRLLEITPDFLEAVLVFCRARGYAILSLDDAVAQLQSTEKKPFFVCFTSDDGYRDNATYAAPLFAKYNAPWTLFVTTSFADGTGVLWWRVLEAYVRRRYTSVNEQYQAFAALYKELRAQPWNNLLESTHHYARNAGLDLIKLTQDACLTWAELRAMTYQTPVSFGAHTLTHPMLAKLPTPDMEAEIKLSRDRLKHELNQKVTFLAYPVGDVDSASTREFDIAQNLEFLGAVTTKPRHVFQNSPLYALPRVSLNGHFQTEAALRGMLSGIPFRSMR